MPDTNSYVEKRIYPRVQVNLPVKYKVFEYETDLTTVFERKKIIKNSHTLDVSSGGLFLMTDHALEVETMLRLDISLPTLSHEISAFAEVVWANPSGAGLRFAAIRNEDAETLRNYLSHISN